ncbi:MAG: hypothetical protein V1705_01815 [bacterium]
MSELSPQTKKLIQHYQAWFKALQPKEGRTVVHVDEVASKVAAFYEKIRGMIDWREEQLLRRSSIERILKRRLFLGQSGKGMAAPFVFELVRGGYFPNDRIEESKIEEVQRLIDKYIFIVQNSPKPPEKRRRFMLYDWLLSLAACETEEILDPLRRERALIDYMEEIMKERIDVVPQIPEIEKNIQLSIATQKALFKLDNAIISYHLLKKRYSQWSNLPQLELEVIAKNIYSIWEDIEKDFKHPLADKFYGICERYDTPYLILGDIISKDPLEIQEKLEKPELLESFIREVYAKRKGKLKSRIRRAAFYSTVSIFLTKILLALAIEIPFDKYVSGQTDYQTMGLNVLIPSFLMFFLVSTIRQAKKSNLERVVLETIKICYSTERKNVYTIRAPRKRRGIINALVNIFYLATFAGSFWVIWWGLEKLNFGILSKIIFLVFFSLISFAGTKIRERAKELSIEEENAGFFSFFLDAFSIPFIRVGKWLSSQWARYNVILVIITALFDMPFQLFTEFLEQWRNFVKEKKEEIH